MKRIRKAIIPAAGLGTRFLPATKATPKEMLPVVDTPAIQYIVEEAAKSGIEDIVIISGRGKRAIEDHFDKSYELEDVLLKHNKISELEEIKGISNMANIYYVRQKEARGLGHAIHCAKTFIGNEPFAVLLGDDLVYSEKPCLSQLMDAYEKYQSSIVGVQRVDKDKVNLYGIIDGDEIAPKVMKVKEMVEKPDKEHAPSNVAILGRYILEPEIFDILENQKPGKNGEIQLTDALKTLLAIQDIYSFEFEGKRYDLGDKLGFVEATIEYALRREDLKQELKAYLKDIAGKF
ncbi:MAG TPA: UTP--glucose-1-phosphate uridylyltransferase GalU [Clostridia bacterium]|nr:MAG: UTP--glucose-1-phosphate uridylyltransferase [Firmicutes bacterium ADurb.Bin146]HOD93815.1 UTP--glucose-1-phosphate uridylyltransferase GalU [Clostridia bacterium]